MIESLVALLMFSIALVGALEAQRKAMQATRQTLTELRAQVLLQDLVGPLEAAAADPRGVALSAAGLPAGVPRALRSWLERSEQTRAVLGQARVCVERADGLATLSLRERAIPDSQAEGCTDDARGTLWHLPLR